MRKSLIILPSGEELFSGSEGGNAIRSCTYTESVNSGTELALGSACCACLELSIFAPAGSLTISQGAEIAYYQVFYPQLGVKLCSMAGGGVQKIYMVFFKRTVPAGQVRQ